jgi:hypothetical protein
MESRPSQVSKTGETILAWLIPPACREEVLGDLRERRRSSARYLLEAASVIPCVVYSRICRTTDSVIALAEALSMYTAFVTAAWWLDSTLLSDERGFVRLAIPPAIILAATILADAYSNPKRHWPLRPLFAPILGVALVYAAQSVLSPWALPAAVLAWGSGVGALLVSSLRLIFPPITDRPQAAHAPAFWQKLVLSPVSLGPRSALLPAVILLCVILYLLYSARSA